MFNFNNFVSVISAQDEITISADEEKKYLLPLLGYLHGYKLGQNFALHLPPVILSPILILPAMKELQVNNIQKSTIERSNQNNRGKFQDVVPTETINTERMDTIDNNLKLSTIADFDIYHNASDNSTINDDMFKQISSDESNTNDSIYEISEINGNLETTPTFSKETSEVNSIEKTNTTRKPYGPYSNAIYNNSDINKLSITAAPLQNNFIVPSAENNWQNFNLPSKNVTKNTTKDSDFNELNSTADNILYFPTTSSTVYSYNPYPPRQYYQNVDTLSITTNSYTNVEHHLPPAYDDRWQRFSSLEKSHLTSGFRPLAGLYYDGFLHRPLNKQEGFRPNQKYNNYNYV